MAAANKDVEDVLQLSAQLLELTDGMNNLNKELQDSISARNEFQAQITAMDERRAKLERERLGINVLMKKTREDLEKRVKEINMPTLDLKAEAEAKTEQKTDA